MPEKFVKFSKLFHNVLAGCASICRQKKTEKSRHLATLTPNTIQAVAGKPFNIYEKF